MSLVSLEDYENEANKILEKKNFEYFRSGAGDELSLSLNRLCFDK